MRNKLVTPISSVSSTTSGYVDVGNAKKITLQFTSDTVSGKTGTLTVLGTIDGTNYYQYNMLVSNVTNTNSQDLTRVSSVALTTDTTELVAIECFMPFLTLKVTVTVAGGQGTTGNFTVKALVEQL